MNKYGAADYVEEYRGYTIELVDLYNESTGSGEVKYVAYRPNGHPMDADVSLSVLKERLNTYHDMGDRANKSNVKKDYSVIQIPFWNGILELNNYNGDGREYFAYVDSNGLKIKVSVSINPDTDDITSVCASADGFESFQTGLDDLTFYEAVDVLNDMVTAVEDHKMSKMKKQRPSVHIGQYLGKRDDVEFYDNPEGGIYLVQDGEIYTEADTIEDAKDMVDGFEPYDANNVR